MLFSFRPASNVVINSLFCLGPATGSELGGDTDIETLYDTLPLVPEGEQLTTQCWPTFVQL